MIQGRLWPLQIVRTEPSPYNTADCHSIGVGDDGLPYFLKRVSDGAHVPVSEFVCTQLASTIDLAVPPCTVAQLPGDAGELCFASRAEGGVDAETESVRLLLQPEMLRAHADRLMQWYAFDLFTHNVDRRLGNFLIRHSILGAALIGIDFSRALLTQGWPHTVPPLPSCNTTTTQRAISKGIPYPPAAAARIMNRIEAAPDGWLDNCLSQVPVTWINAKVRRDICRWWRNNRQKRLHLLRSHLTDGRYLRLFPHSRRTRPSPR